MTSSLYFYLRNLWLYILSCNYIITYSMCRFPFVKEWFNEMQTAKNGESKRETSEAYLGLKKRERKKWRDYRWFLFISTLVFIIAKMKQIIPIYNTFHLYLHKYIYKIKTFMMFIVKLLTVMYDYKSLLLKKMGKLIKPIKNLSPNVKSISTSHNNNNLHEKV